MGENGPKTNKRWWRGVGVRGCTSGSAELDPDGELVVRERAQLAHQDARLVGRELHLRLTIHLANGRLPTLLRGLVWREEHTRH